MHEIKKIEANKLTFDCRIAGNPNGELILFLHGFPETNYMWRNLMQHFAELGYYCIAPNMRGCSKDACPEDKVLYGFQHLSSDVLGIFKQLSKDKFHLVGHDWGAAVGWQIAHDKPELIYSFSALSFPHNQAFREAIISDSDQKRRAVYSKIFAWPIFPEMLMTAFNHLILRKVWTNSAQDEVNDYLSVFKNAKSLSSFLNYYRVHNSIYRPSGPWQQLGEVHTPTLFIWGKKDYFIGKRSVSESRKYMAGYYKYIELDTNHWLIQTKYDEVKNAITQHISRNSSN